MEPREDGFPADGLSWVRGCCSQPLLEVTIPALLAGCATARPDATAAVFRGEGVRWTWEEFARRVDALAGASAAGLRQGGQGGHLGAQSLGTAPDAVCHRADWRHSGDDQPGLPPERTGKHAETLGLPGLPG